MKYYKRLKIYKNSTETNWFDPAKLEARSYNHWVYLREIDGILVMNDFSYSVTTAGHQNDLKTILRKMDVTPDLVLRFTDKSLNYDFRDVLLSELSETLFYLKELEEKQETGRPSSAAFRYRKEEMKQLTEHAKILTTYIYG